MLLELGVHLLHVFVSVSGEGSRLRRLGRCVGGGVDWVVLVSFTLADQSLLLSLRYRAHGFFHFDSQDAGLLHSSSSLGRRRRVEWAGWVVLS